MREEDSDDILALDAAEDAAPQHAAVQLAQTLKLHPDVVDHVERMVGAARSPVSESLSLAQTSNSNAPLSSLARLAGDEQIGGIVGEALAQGASANETNVEPVFTAMSALQLKIEKEHQQDTVTYTQSKELCDKTIADLRKVISDSTASQRAATEKDMIHRNSESQAHIDWQHSMSRQRDIEETLKKARAAQLERVQSYVSKRRQRRGDIEVLHSAVELICTFSAFQDDERCVDHKVAHSVVAKPDEPQSSEANQLDLLTAEHDEMIAQSQTSWNQQILQDSADIAAGTPPSDVSRESSAMSLAQMAQYSYAAKDKLQHLVATSGSDAVVSQAQAVLLSVEAGEYDKTNSMLQLVESHITTLEARQLQDQQEEEHFRADSRATVENQETAREMEVVLQAKLRKDVARHRTTADQAKLDFNAAVHLREGTEHTLQQNEHMCDAERQAHEARVAMRTDEVSNIVRLRSLLRVMGGAAAPSCDPQNDCTSASQGMCVFAEQGSRCACEHQFYGNDCEKRKCPGRGERLYRKDEADACTGIAHGTCDEDSGLCTCNPAYKHGSRNACELHKYCPRHDVAGGHCNGHGRCEHSTGECTCNQDYFGLDCSKKKCPGGTSSLLYESHDNEVCSGHGVCETESGKCRCHATYTGSKCMERTCPSNCNGHGACSIHSGSCICDHGYHADMCQARDCPGGCGGSAGKCDTSSGRCLCNDGFSGPQCKPTKSCDVQDTTYEQWAMFRTGWSACKKGWLMTGMKRGPCNGLHCIEQARCARPCWGEQRLTLQSCYQANWWDVFNAAGQASCEDGYYMAGVYRSNCLSLYCLQMGLCCSISSSSWNNCGAKDWSSEIRKSNSWAVVPSSDAGGKARPLAFMVGLERAGQSATLDDLHYVKYCSFRRND